MGICFLPLWAFSSSYDRERDKGVMMDHLILRWIKKETGHSRVSDSKKMAG